MIEVDALPPHRVLLVCCDTAVPQALHQLLAQTGYWEAGLDVGYGDLQLHVVLLQEVPHLSREQPAAASFVSCLDVLKFSLQREQYQWTLSATVLAALLELAGQQDWIVFLNDAPPGSELAMLQLLLAERMHDFLWASAESSVDRAVFASDKLPAAKPVFIQCQPENTPNEWPAFYQQLDSNSRWQQLIHCRWMMISPDKNSMQRVVAEEQSWLAERLYVLLLGSTASDIGPRLDELTMANLLGQGIATNTNQVGAMWLDWCVFASEESRAETEPLKVSFSLLPVEVYNADTRLTAVSVWQGSLLDCGADLNCWPKSHHKFTYVRICLKQLPQDLTEQHLLLIQQQQPRPLWRLRGYWRLCLV